MNSGGPRHHICRPHRVYYSAQILLFGAEFTQTYATEYGSHLLPKEHAVRLETKEVPVD